MSEWLTIAVIAALLGSAVIGGVFFAFSGFVMTALSRLSAVAAVTAMQSINVVVINPAFLGVFLGTACLALGIGGFAVCCVEQPSAVYLLAGSLCYLAGTLLVTLRANVPLNDRLAAAAAADPGTHRLWDHYRVRWTAWNHVRTVAAIVAALLFAVALVQSGPR